MTRRTNSRIAGATFLFYIVIGIVSMILFSGATGGEGIGAQLTSIAGHATAVRVTIVLGLLMNLSALVLAVTLYALTRDQDSNLAMLALLCRVGEGLAGADTSRALGLLWLATATGADAPDAGTAAVLGPFLLKTGGWGPSAIFFAAGSTLFCWLFLRGRIIPVALARLGVFASALLVVLLPLQLAGLLGGPAPWRGMIAWLQWLPMLVFEIALALWLIIRGASPVARPQTQGESA